MKEKSRKLFRAWDVVIILFVILASVLALLSQINRGEDKLCCVIRVNGEIVYSAPLDSIEEEEHFVTDTQLPVTVVIGSDGVRVLSSACPDKLCEHTGIITKGGQSIVCLPAQVTVTLESDKNEVDAVVR